MKNCKKCGSVLKYCGFSNRETHEIFLTLDKNKNYQADISELAEVAIDSNDVETVIQSLAVALYEYTEKRGLWVVFRVLGISTLSMKLARLALDRVDFEEIAIVYLNRAGMGW